MDTIIPAIRLLFDRNSLFQKFSIPNYITAVRKIQISERAKKKKNPTADLFVIRE